MRPAVGLEDLVIEILDPKAEAADAKIPDHLQLAFGQRARFAFEGDLLGLIPGEQAFHALDQAGKLA